MLPVALVINVIVAARLGSRPMGHVRRLCPDRPTEVAASIAVRLHLAEPGWDKECAVSVAARSHVAEPEREDFARGPSVTRPVVAIPLLHRMVAGLSHVALRVPPRQWHTDFIQI